VSIEISMSIEAPIRGVITTHSGLGAAKAEVDIRVERLPGGVLAAFQFPHPPGGPRSDLSLDRASATALRDRLTAALAAEPVPAGARLKSAKEYLASGERPPEGVSPEDLPCNMPAAADCWGHGEDPANGGDLPANGGSCYIPRTFYRMTPWDAPKRRALWMRFPPCNVEDDIFRPDGSLVELRAGREGDDAHLLLKVGDVLTQATILEIIDLFLTVRFGLEEFFGREEKRAGA